MPSLTERVFSNVNAPISNASDDPNNTLSSGVNWIDMECRVPEERNFVDWNNMYTIVWILCSEKGKFWGHRIPFRKTLVGFLTEELGEEYLAEWRNKNPDKYGDYHLGYFTLSDLGRNVHETKWENALIYCPNGGGKTSLADLPTKKIFFVDNTSSETTAVTVSKRSLKIVPAVPSNPFHSAICRFELKETGSPAHITVLFEREYGAQCSVCESYLPEDEGVESLLVRIDQSDKAVIAEILAMDGLTCIFKAWSRNEYLAILSACGQQGCISTLKNLGKTTGAYGGKISRVILGIKDEFSERSETDKGYNGRNYLLLEKGGNSDPWNLDKR